MTAMSNTTIPPNAASTLSAEQIEQTLHDLWQSIEQDEPAMQVRTLNLLVYLPTPPDAATETAIQMVALQHPGRTIVLQPESGPPHADVSLACRLHDAGHACGERIVLRGGGNGEALHSLALGLLQPGLSGVLWWVGSPPLETHPFVPLANAVDQILVDSRTWDDARALLPRFAELRQRRAGVVRFSDLQWVSLTPWRQLIAQAFDSATAQPLLGQISAVTITVGEQGQIVAGLLLAGWLMSRLGWHARSAQSSAADITEFALQRGDQPLTLTVRAGAGGAGISEVALDAAASAPARFAFRAEPASSCVITTISLPETPVLEHITPLRSTEIPTLIAEELAISGADPVYTAALSAALQLLGLLGDQP